MRTWQLSIMWMRQSYLLQGIGGAFHWAKSCTPLKTGTVEQGRWAMGCLTGALVELLVVVEPVMDVVVPSCCGKEHARILLLSAVLQKSHLLPSSQSWKLWSWEVRVASAAWARLRLAAAGWLKHSESQLIRTQLASGSPPGLLSHPQATRLGLGPQHGAPTTCSSLLLAVCTPSLFWRCSTS